MTHVDNFLLVGNVMEMQDYSKQKIETKDLILKKAVQGDWIEMFENIWKHEESAKFMSWSVTTSGDEAFERMQRTINFQREHKYAFLVFERATNRPIGFAGMQEKEPGVYEETGIAFGPSFTGKGYGTQCLSALMEEARSCGAKKFEACCRTGNLASHALQMKLGFATVRFEDRIDERNGESYVMEMNEKWLV